MALTILLLGTVLLTGFATTSTVYGPGALPLPARASLVLCFGYAVPATIAFCLAALGVLNPATMLIGLLCAFAVTLWVGARRFGLRRQWSSLFEEARTSRIIAFGLIVLACFALYRVAFPPALNFLQSTAFRYFADGAQIADAGAVPEQVLHWGQFYPPTVSKALPNSFTASLVLAAGREPLQVLGPLLWFASVGLAVALWGLVSELGLRYTAPFVPILLLADPGVLNAEMTSDLLTYKTEILGRMVAVTALLIGIRALGKERSRVNVIVAGVLLAVTGATHVTPLVVVLIALFWYGVAEAMISRRIKAVAFRLGAMLLVAIPLILVIPVLSGGDLGFEGVRGDEAYSSFEGEQDPTALFADPRAYLNGRESSRTVIPSAGQISESYVSTAVGKHISGWATVPLVLLFAILAVAIVKGLDEPIRRIGLIAGGLGVSLLILCLIIAVRFDTYIPGATGLRRLFDYNSLPVVLVIAALAESLIILMQRRSLQTPLRILAVTAVALSLAAMQAALPSAKARSVTASSGKPFDWLEENTPCGSRILATSRTEGVFESVAGRIGVLEGMSPYLRPSMLRDVNETISRAHSFFSQPKTRAAFLSEERVDFIYVRGNAAMGGSRIAPKNIRRVTDLPFLTEVYASEAAQIFSVGPPYADSQDLETGVPGYFCDGNQTSAAGAPDRTGG